MRPYLVVGNWKMHGCKASIAELLNGIKVNLRDNPQAAAVCPPAVYLGLVAESLEGTTIGWGGQNVSDQPEGAFTGEVSAAMLADMGCRYAIVGHSERRMLFGESNEFVAAKFKAVRDHGISPILCVGESLQQREAGETLDWVERQLRAVAEIAGIDAFVGAVVAYEPIWAIGTGETATPVQAEEVHAHIRRVMANIDREVAENLQILYGGSVKPNNAAELFARQNIDGALVGGASLKAEDFVAIVRAAGSDAREGS